MIIIMDWNGTATVDRPICANIQFYSFLSAKLQDIDHILTGSEHRLTKVSTRTQRQD